MIADLEHEPVVERLSRAVDETSGLVNAPLDSPMLQPYEVFDQELFDLEMVRVFGRSWVWLGDTEDLAEPGDYITGTIGYQPVMVIRQEDGSVRGFLNNCRHRASGLLFEPAGNCGKTMTCPYHNWAYAIDGQLVGIPDRARMYPEGMPTEDYGLAPIRIEVAWDKLVFGCLSRKAPPFPEWIAPLAERYDLYKFGTFTRYHRELDQTYPINWKAFAENSNDDYHVRFVHRRLNKLRKQMDTIVRFEGRTCSGFKPHSDEEDATGGRTDLTPEQLLGHYADYIYPNLTPLPYPTQLILVRADPIAPDRTRLFSRVYGIDKSIAEQDFELDRLAVTNREDTDMVTVLMNNLRSPFYRVGPASTWEGRAAHVMKMVRADVATPLAADEFSGPLPAN
ncbi:MAG: aromatic ring-hydroxylating dioxygenase subunit alpha [Acidimicrobiaceae bacterium]|nr:aromatic ring-hydroxylating dioxygenase subunit alpha [Acidimicrobiaceae bacterium]MYB87834.1 aromatic ring-hydroxylating dioxygenase subunit alpha [Acidimicrobiaceae bacterium]MYI36459.1 aromatic ring-hydroxylating dioxygenase subunit alpha [Acidimicrobiaceae bacterium]